MKTRTYKESLLVIAKGVMNGEFVKMDKKLRDELLKQYPKWTDLVEKYKWSWYIPELLQTIYGLPSHTKSNLKRSRRKRPWYDANKIEEYKINESNKRLADILKEALEFYIVKYLGIDINADEGIKKILKLTSTQIKKSPFSGIFASKYVNVLDKDKLSGNGGEHSEFGFLCHTLYPGKKWFAEKKLLPQMFNGAARGYKLNSTELAELVSWVYLYKICDLNPLIAKEEDINKAKKDFILNRVTIEKVSEYIAIKSLLRNCTSTVKFSDITDMIANYWSGKTEGFSISSSDHASWSKSKFEQLVEDIKMEEFYKKCFVTGKSSGEGIELEYHHLIFRERAPGFAYDPKNIVSLIKEFHRFLHNHFQKKSGPISSSARSQYLDAIKKWSGSPEEDRSPQIFKIALQKIYQEFKDYYEKLLIVNKS